MSNDPHDIMFNNVPTLLEEEASEAIRPRSLVTWHVVDRFKHLTLRHRGVNAMQIELLPIEIFAVFGASPHAIGKMVVDELLLGVVLGHPGMVFLYLVDIIFFSSWW